MSAADDAARDHEVTAHFLLPKQPDPRNPVNEATAAAICHALLAISARLADWEDAS